MDLKETIFFIESPKIKFELHVINSYILLIWTKIKISLQLAANVKFVSVLK
jgi:hypothetical protein